MKKEEHMQRLDEIQKMVNNIRSVKTINEAIRFNEDEFDDYGGYGADEDEMGREQCANGECNLEKMKGEEPTEEDGLRELGEVDMIREIALKGMIKLCKNPEDERYQALKKIFQFCDKAAEPKDKEENR